MHILRTLIMDIPKVFNIVFLHKGENYFIYIYTIYNIYSIFVYIYSICVYIYSICAYV